MTGRGKNLLESFNFFHFHSKATAIEHSSHIFMFYLSAQSSKLLYMQDRIPFSPTLNKLLNNKIEYFCFVVSRVRCLLLLRSSFSFSGGNDKRTETEDKKQSGKEKQIHRVPARGKSMGMITSRIIIIMSVACCLLMKCRLRIVWRASSA